MYKLNLISIVKDKPPVVVYSQILPKTGEWITLDSEQLLTYEVVKIEQIFNIDTMQYIAKQPLHEQRDLCNHELTVYLKPVGTQESATQLLSIINPYT